MRKKVAAEFKPPLRVGAFSNDYAGYVVRDRNGHRVAQFVEERHARVFVEEVNKTL